MAEDFIAIEDLSGRMQRTLSDDDLLAQEACTAACDLIAQLSSQALDLVMNDVVILDSDGGDTLLLPEMPVVGVSEVSLILSDGSESVIDPLRYVVDYEMGAVRTKSTYTLLNWIKGRGIYKVTYSHGYEEIPYSIKVLALTVAQRLYDQGMVKQDTVGGIVSIYSTETALSLNKVERDHLEKALGVGRRR